MEPSRQPDQGQHLTGEGDLQRADPVVTVRYWAAARAATGIDSEQLSGATVGAVLEAAVARHPALEPAAAIASVLVDGSTRQRTDRLTDGVTVEVLPPFAGG